MPPNSVAHPRQPITRNYSPRGAHLLSDSGCNICFVYFSTTDIVHGKAVQFLLLHEDLSLQYVIPAVSLWYSNEMSRFVLRGSYFAVRTSRFVLRGSYFMAWQGAQISLRHLALDITFIRLKRVHKTTSLNCLVIAFARTHHMKLYIRFRRLTFAFSTLSSVACIWVWWGSKNWKVRERLQNSLSLRPAVFACIWVWCGS